MPISSSPSFSQLRAFVALCDHQHFGEAATALGVSQPSLSQASTALEKRVGGELVERTTRRVLVTSLGEALLPFARDAVLAAASLVDAAESEAKEATAERDAREKAELTRALGLESDGKIPAALRAQIRQLEEDQKRRAKRARTDVLDRAMIDLLSFYRDVLTTQMGSDVERVNLDLADAVDQAARTTTPEQSLARIAAIEECRSRLRSNAAPLLAVEALMVQLRPQAEGG